MLIDNQFQFLLVRLLVGEVTAQCPAAMISIPLGAIIRKYDFTLTSSLTISIPLGAIIRITSSSTLFVFTISIPLGAIISLQEIQNL